MRTNKKFSEITLIPEYLGKKKGNFFEIPIKCFGRDCTQRYKIHGFDVEDNECYVFASRINKRTGKIPNNAPLVEGFEFAAIFK